MFLKSLWSSLKLDFECGMDDASELIGKGHSKLWAYGVILPYSMVKEMIEWRVGLLSSSYKIRKKRKINLKSLPFDDSDRSNIMLHSVFNLIVDFVEIELPHQKLFSITRDSEYGINDLSNDKQNWFDGHANEILQLYLWWKNDYLNREEPYDMCDRVFGSNDEYNKRWNRQYGCIYSFYELEEKAMLLRAMKIRDKIW